VSSKEGTHTPVNTSSLDIEPGTLVRQLLPAFDAPKPAADLWPRATGLVVDVIHAEFGTSVTAEVLWLGSSETSVVSAADLIPLHSAH